MTHKKRPSTKKMDDYINEKIEIAHELGTCCLLYTSDAADDNRLV